MDLNNIESFNRNNELNEIDPDSHIPIQSNFKYYTTSDFSDDNIIKNCLSEKSCLQLHCNIRSINANLDHLIQMLAELQHNFTIIGLTETKLKVGNDIPIGNNIITGYHFISHTSLSNASGTGFFVSNQVRFIERDDLSEITADFETQWIEIESDLHHNMIDAPMVI